MEDNNSEVTKSIGNQKQPGISYKDQDYQSEVLFLSQLGL